jgi:hypothetical protein
MPRYGDKEGRYMLTFREDDIPALLPRKNEQIAIKQKSQIFTINQLRAEYGDDPMDGGNDLYGQGMLTPIAKDNSGLFKVNDLEKDEEPDDVNAPRGTTPEEDAEDEAAIAVTKEKFINVLALQKEKDGTRRFTDDEIKEMASRHYGN